MQERDEILKEAEKLREECVKMEVIFLLGLFTLFPFYFLTTFL